MIIAARLLGATRWKVIAALGGEFSFVKAFHDMVVQVRIFDNCGSNRFIAEQTSFGQPAVPFLCREIALSNPNQCIQFRTRRRR